MKIRRCRGDHGSTTVAITFAVAVVLIFVVQVVNLLVFNYGKGAVRNALDEGARAGSRAGPAACVAAANGAVGDLIGGMSSGVSISCTETGTRIVATATVHFDGWFGSVADYDGTLTASAAREDR